LLRFKIWRLRRSARERYGGATSRRSPLSYCLGVIAPPALLLHLYAPRIAIIVSRVCATCTALSLHTHPVDRSCHIAAFYAVAAAITPRRFVLPIRRRGSVVRFDRSAVTMMIYPSEGYVIRRRVGTYRRSASRLRRAVCAADVLRSIRRATDLSLRLHIAPLT